MKPRITFSISVDGLLEIFVNEVGRDMLVRELQGLSERNDHFHFGPSDADEVQVQSMPYKKDDKVLQYGKVYYRPDVWDQKHFPHVLSDPN